jgi:hypothetical protein
MNQIARSDNPLENGDLEQSNECPIDNVQNSTWAQLNLRLSKDISVLRC